MKKQPEQPAPVKQAEPAPTPSAKKKRRKKKPAAAQSAPQKQEQPKAQSVKQPAPAKGEKKPQPKGAAPLPAQSREEKKPGGKKTRGRNHTPNLDPQKPQIKDSTEQKSLMKPFYLDFKRPPAASLRSAPPPEGEARAC